MIIINYDKCDDIHLFVYVYMFINYNIFEFKMIFKTKNRILIF